MKKSICYIILLIGFTVNAQWDGTYNTKFGIVKLIQEAGNTSNNFEQIVYGDYGQNGTMIGKVVNQGRELHGTFHNGSQTGSFIWRKVGVGDPINIRNFSGYWGYGTQTNDYSNNEDHKWNGEQTQRIRPTDINNAIWSGKWNTNFGEMILEQTGVQVKGKYINNGKVGEMNGLYNKNNKTFSGSYTENGRKGFYVFTMNNDGNSFTGKWGWTIAMTESTAWNGTKAVKSNKSFGSTTSNNTSQTNSSNATTTSNQNTKVKVWFKHLLCSQGDIYGLWGVKLFKVTQNNRVLVNSFGNKNEVVYNADRNSSRVIKPKSHQFSNSPDNFREYIISIAELNNPNIKFEIEIITHPKSKKTIGSDLDYGRQKKIIELKNLPSSSDQTISNHVQGSTVFGTGLATYTVTISKSPHQ